MKNAKKLFDKICVVTGAGGIIGSAICQRLLLEGASVVALDHDEDRLKTLSIHCNEKKFSPLATDIRSEKSVKLALDYVLKKWGRCDVLINNAASKSKNFFNSFENFPMEDWRDVMAVNVGGAMLCAQAFGPLMVQQGTGSIINVLSIYGISGPDQRIYDGSLYEGQAINTPAVYSASKAALWGLTQYLACYWGKYNVRTNGITPGGIFSGQNDTFVKKYTARVPMERMGEVNDLTGAFVFLASDESGYMNGQNLVIDGGLTTW